MGVGKEILTEEERAAIQAVVAQVEKRTSGEVVPMIVGRSDSYPGVRWKCALFVVFAWAAGIALVDPHFPVWLLALSLPVVSWGGYLLGATGLAVRWFANPETLKEEVHQRALQAFLALDLSATKNRTGILVFFSVLEHRVEVIADRGIHEKVGQEVWSVAVSGAIEKIRSKGLATAVIHAVEVCGGVLIQHFPRRDGDQNEIPNRVIISPE